MRVHESRRSAARNRKRLHVRGAGAHNAATVKKFIRSTVTRAFLAKEGGWTQDISKAREIAGFWDASQIMHSLELQGVEVYFSFEGVVADVPGDFAVPLD